MPFSIKAASSTFLVSGPQWSNDQLSGTTPYRLTRPYVGLSPTTPSTEAGMRIEPPVSVPIAARQELAATAAPEPALEPPGVRSRSQGLRVGGMFWPYANSCVTVLPTTIAPA